METNNTYQIESVTRALEILELLANNGGAGRITDIAREMGCSKNTTFRLLQTLQAHGYVRQADDSSYELTFKLLKLGESVLRNTEIPDVARPYLQNLAQTLGETSTLAFLDGNDIVYVERVHGTMPHNTSYTIGSRAKACSTALGKAMLAYSPIAIVEQILSQGLMTNTPYTITDPDQFRAELEHIALGHYAIDNQENVLGIRCVAAPIFDRKGEVVAAISISGLAVRLTDDRLEEFSTHVMNTAKSISQRLGYED